MQTRVTAISRIEALPEVIETAEAYKRGLQLCVDEAWKRRIRNNFKLHPFIYRRLKNTGLQAQIVVDCIKQACGMIKKAKSKPVIKRCSIQYNFPRSASFKNNILSISTLKGRVKLPFTIPKCYTKYFNPAWKICESLLTINKSGKAYFRFTFSREIDARRSRLHNRVLGVDLGVKNLAVTSNGRFYHPNKVRNIKRKFKYLRGKLQTKGTRSAKRLLKKLSGREQRFMAWTNHNISKSIVSEFRGNKIVMEDLKGIGKIRRGKRMNYWISNWSFYQLQSFIQYKAQQKGIEVVKVKPNYTSQICHKCGQLGSRSKGCFSCFHCGVSSYSADLNAAKNLAHPMLVERQGAVTHPNNSSCDAKGNSQVAIEAELRVKSPAF